LMSIKSPLREGKSAGERAKLDDPSEGCVRKGSESGLTL
jgi:hypothetical protein